MNVDRQLNALGLTSQGVYFILRPVLMDALIYGTS